MINNISPGDPSFRVTADNKPLLKEWLIAQGILPARVEGMRQDTMARAYTCPAFLRAMQSRKDYCPTGAPKEDTPCVPGSPDASTCIAASEPTAQRPINSAECGQRAGIRSGTEPLTEARVIELILEYAPRAIAQKEEW